MAATILVIDDNPAIAALSADLLKEEGSVHIASDSVSGLEQARRLSPQVVILDLIMPGVRGMELLEKLLEIDSGTDVILLTGHYSTDSAVEAIQRGACDYLTKPIVPERLCGRVRRCLADREGRRRSIELDSELLRASRFEGIVGRSAAMLELFSRMHRAAPHYQTALVTGDTGTGKELIAAALHRLSPVAHKPYVVCNCAALVETLFESELFGHVKGAFTGAIQHKQGLVEQAQGGTLFLDEIGEMPLSTQAKLLRLLQNREIQRLGSPAAMKVDVRIIAATHQDLKQMVAEKRFREDLYYRLSTMPLRVPSLMNRREDLPLLQRHFLNMYSERYGRPGLEFGRRTLAVLSTHTWPGNVRELENAVSHACMMVEGPIIETRHLPESIRCQQSEQEAAALPTLKALERQHIQRVLEFTNGNIMQAARILGISRATLYRLIASSDSVRLGGSVRI